MNSLSSLVLDAINGNMTAWKLDYALENGLSCFKARDSEEVYSAYLFKNKISVMCGISTIYNGSVKAVV